jgi:hypothetical protein
VNACADIIGEHRRQLTLGRGGDGVELAELDGEGLIFRRERGSRNRYDDE